MTSGYEGTYRLVLYLEIAKEGLVCFYVKAENPLGRSVRRRSSDLPPMNQERIRDEDSLEDALAKGASQVLRNLDISEYEWRHMWRYSLSSRPKLIAWGACTRAYLESIDEELCADLDIESSMVESVNEAVYREVLRSAYSSHYDMYLFRTHTSNWSILKRGGSRSGMSMSVEFCYDIDVRKRQVKSEILVDRLRTIQRYMMFEALYTSPDRRSLYLNVDYEIVGMLRMVIPHYEVDKKQ